MTELSARAEALRSTLSSNEIDRLLVGAIGDIREELNDPQAFQRPPNPAKVEEYLAFRCRMFDRRVARLNDLLAVWHAMRMERITPDSPAAS